MMTLPRLRAGEAAHGALAVIHLMILVAES